KKANLGELGVDCVEVPSSASGVDLAAVLRILGSRDVVRLLVEGGPRLCGAFLDLGLVDRVAIFVAPSIVGDSEAPSFASGRGVDRIAEANRIKEVTWRRMGEDFLLEGDLGT